MPNYNALSLISKIRSEAHKLIASELEKRGIEDIVPSHGDVLVHLYQQDGLSIKELALKVHLTQPTVTVLVNKLERLEYVCRVKSGEDSRITFVKLTDKGISLQQAFREISDTLNEALYGGLNPAQQEDLECLLEHIYRRF
ncbi:MarR family transcriptional regulator [Paenibacillus helianthi]|uniref:MarR family transcriptional regulator n=1 Tax=Paenibacillus helianthi TaxID=1349432 RepID=A0ABX3ET33_9BACL|nr:MULTISPECIES: MarR family transcriptional regulator [Paenibacillus]OKP66967.1 MarR family transcriptional regulator [Paenibacillus sp. P3E]OKP90359.1 MarR family transcriptional regulator [Paenibacillus sp. P32E]OKP90495.1 MarR family transcriptional regulator [Paenibacillus helianthi]